MKDEIYSLELPAGLDTLIDLTIRVGDRIALCSQHEKGGFPVTASRGAEPVTTCDTRSQRLTLPEADHLAAARLVAGRRLSRKEEQMVSVTNTRLPSVGRPDFQASLRLRGPVFQVSALIDSGAEGDFMDSGLATRLGILSVALAKPISSRTLCGTLLTKITEYHHVHHINLVWESCGGDPIPPYSLTHHSFGVGSHLVGQTQPPYQLGSQFCVGLEPFLFSAMFGCCIFPSHVLFCVAGGAGEPGGCIGGLP